MLGRAGAQDISNTLWGVASIQRQQQGWRGLEDPGHDQHSSMLPDGGAAAMGQSQPSTSVINSEQLHALVDRFIQVGTWGGGYLLG